MVVIPEGITKIAGSLFDLVDPDNNYANATSIVVLPTTLTTIDGNPFINCARLFEVYNLSNIELSIGQTTNGYVSYHAKYIYSSMEEESVLLEDNGFVYYISGDEVVLHHYEGSESEIVIPSYITRIGNAAFCGSTVKKISIPSTVKIINAYYPFYKSSVEQIVFEQPNGWMATGTSYDGGYFLTPLNVLEISNPYTAASVLIAHQSMFDYSWICKM